MRRNILFLVVGLLVGALLATGATTWAANQQVRLFVDGKEISFADAPPQMINGRMMVPARPLAEALGARVEWDQAAQSVRVTSDGAAVAAPDAAAISQTLDRNTLIEILKAKYPGVATGFRGSLVTIGDSEYDVAPTLHANRVYVDISNLLSVGVITSSDLSGQ